MALHKARTVVSLGLALSRYHGKSIAPAATSMAYSTRQLPTRRNSTLVEMITRADSGILETIPTTSHSMKIIFNDHQTCDFKYIWLRDNCHCSRCIHPDSHQKLVDTARTDINIQPKTFHLNADGQLVIEWNEQGSTHCSVYDANWLQKYGRSFTLDSFEKSSETTALPPVERWDRVSIWKSMPEISYREVMETEDGLRTWLEMIYRYGVAVMRDVPCKKDEIIDVANRFAYVKTTIWGPTFDVICEPVQSDPSHLAYTGMQLELHTDMNYREKSPGFQMLHCLKANNAAEDGHDVGGKSFFADGFFIAKWLQDNQPSAYHILSSTPVKFAIRSHSMNYSQTIPVICLDKDGEVQEIHYNNRTMSPLQVPSHLVMPFYHAYRLMGNKLRDPSCQLTFNMVPGDLVAFNNRRVLHGRTSFDPTKMHRHLQGCYVDIDEVFTRFRSFHGV